MAIGYKASPLCQQYVRTEVETLMLKTGVLLLNLGTTQSPSYWHVFRFLREFLTDGRVIDLPFFIRSLLVYGLILPFRPFKVMHAYKTIWTKNGSPFVIYHQSLLKQLRSLSPQTPIELGMRYGDLSIKKALDNLKKQGCNHLIVLPLFPQYATASTGSAIAKLYTEIAQWWDPPTVDITLDFFDDEDFIDAQSNLIKPLLQNNPIDAIIYSFHGVPVRHLQKSGCPNALNCQISACSIPDKSSRLCYKAQCKETARLLHQALNTDIPKEVAFQSRLGSIPWIKPYLDEALYEWHKLGYKNLLIVCPSFTVDCLETLEEIQLRFKEDWESLTGGTVITAPCVNDDRRWVMALGRWINQKLSPQLLVNVESQEHSEIVSLQ
ncbi:ferrochelatase [bacterium]|nr:ferrochelatase [bacterium]